MPQIVPTQSACGRLRVPEFLRDGDRNHGDGSRHVSRERLGGEHHRSRSGDPDHSSAPTLAQATGRGTLRRPTTEVTSR